MLSPMELDMFAPVAIWIKSSTLIGEYVDARDDEADGLWDMQCSLDAFAQIEVEVIAGGGAKDSFEKVVVSCDVHSDELVAIL